MLGPQVRFHVHLNIEFDRILRVCQFRFKTRQKVALIATRTLFWKRLWFHNQNMSISCKNTHINSNLEAMIAFNLRIFKHRIQIFDWNWRQFSQKSFIRDFIHRCGKQFHMVTSLVLKIIYLVERKFFQRIFRATTSSASPVLFQSHTWSSSHCQSIEHSQFRIHQGQIWSCLRSPFNSTICEISFAQWWFF